MEDSFENRLAGQTPVKEKKKSGKGWMIGFFVTLVVLIGVGVFAGILFFNKGDDGKAKIAELEDQIKEKEEELVKCKNEVATTCDVRDQDSTENNSNNSAANTQTDVINIDINGLKSAAKKIKGLKDYTGIKISMSEGGKYIVSGGQAEENALTGGYYLYMYKENKAGATWKALYDTQTVISCSNLTQAQKDVFHGVENCLDDEGHEQAI
jgi:flagellar basal body-associated protein FliL